MFVSQAHSFRQQARLAVTLAWVAGYTNIVTLLTCGTVISHVSGTTSKMGSDFFGARWAMAWFAVFLLGMFFCGAAISGFCAGLGKRRHWESIYVLPIVAETVLLATFAVLLCRHGTPALEGGALLYWLTGLASAAMGLQNATITMISSGHVRTTHVTGVLTDLGHESVQFAWSLLEGRRGAEAGGAGGAGGGGEILRRPEAQRLMMLWAIISMFAFGSGLGMVGHRYAMRWAMFLPVGFLLWLIYQDVTKPIAEIERSMQLGEGDRLGMPASLAMFHLRKDRDRRGLVHRMPNLLAWSERLEAGTRVVILDLGEVTELSANAALELRQVASRLSAEGRHLILTGIDHARFEQLHVGVGAEGVSLDNVCPDLELAIAQGLNFLEGNAGSSAGVTHAR